MNKPFFIAISGKKGSGKDELARQLMTRLSSDHQLDVAITHFADPLKEICIQLFGLDKAKVYGTNADKETLTNVMWDGFPLRVRCKYSNTTIKKPFNLNQQVLVTDDLITWDADGAVYREPRTGPMTHRELLQIMGSDIFRERVYSNIWAEYPFKQGWEVYDDLIQLDSNEHDKYDVVMIADCRFPNEVETTLKNNGLVIRIVRDTGHNDNHPSETALDNYSWQANPMTVVINNNGTLDDLKASAKQWADWIMYHINGGTQDARSK